MADGQPSISVNPEDSGGYRRGGAKRRRPAGEGSRKGMLGVNLMLTILVAGLMVAGWFIANQHQLLLAEQKKLVGASDRIVQLEDRLRVTDEAMTDVGQDTGEKLNFWESEIRKLWAVTNDRNKVWIKNNEKMLAVHQKLLAELQASNKDMKSKVDGVGAAFAKQEAVVDQLASIEIQMQQLMNQRDLVDKMNATRQSVASLDKGLAIRVVENEQAITAIDAYRIQLNTRLTELERQLNALSGAPRF